MPPFMTPSLMTLFIPAMLSLTAPRDSAAAPLVAAALGCVMLGLARRR